MKLNKIFYYGFLTLFLVVVAFQFSGIFFPEIVVAQQEQDVIPTDKQIPTKQDQTGIVDLHTEYDYRAFVFDAYFAEHNSPLHGYGRNFVEACDKYGAPHDCTTLLAIGWVETRNCTLDLSFEQRNCWGWGGAGENRVIFEDFDESIDYVIEKLMTLPFYGTEFMNDPVVGQFYYCGKHCNKYGSYVQKERERISDFAVELGFPPLIEKKQEKNKKEKIETINTDNVN